MTQDCTSAGTLADDPCVPFFVKKKLLSHHKHSHKTNNNINVTAALTVHHPNEGSATEDKKPSIYWTHHGTRETEEEPYSTDLVHNACGRAHLSVGILWILLNMRSSLLRMRMRAGRTASDDQSVMGSISMM